MTSPDTSVSFFGIKCFLNCCLLLDFVEALLTVNLAAYEMFCSRTQPLLREQREGGGLVWSCTRCSKTSCHKMQMMKHAESVHLKTNDPTYGYHCNICNEFCLSYNLLNKHKRVAHRSENTLLWNKL